MEWRKKWAKNWDEVRYCSDACRKKKSKHADALEAKIDELLDARSSDSSICPSDAARAIGGEEWRDLMEESRQAARRMVARGEVEITQGGHVVDPSTAKGPIRIRRPR